MNKMADNNGRPAGPLRNAKLAIMVCGDLDKAFACAKDRVNNQKALLNLPDNLVCHSIIAFGYPKDNEFI